MSYNLGFSLKYCLLQANLKDQFPLMIMFSPTVLYSVYWGHIWRQLCRDVWLLCEWRELWCSHRRLSWGLPRPLPHDHLPRPVWLLCYLRTTHRRMPDSLRCRLLRTTVCHAWVSELKVCQLFRSKLLWVCQLFVSIKHLCKNCYECVTNQCQKFSSDSPASVKCQMAGVFSACTWGRWGQNCDETCGGCGQATECDPVTGTCNNTCLVGYHGPSCQRKALNPTFRS